MSENPYEAPKTVQPLAPEKTELFNRLGGYLRWSFRIGLLFLIVAAIVHTRTDGTMDTMLGAVSIIGSILVVSSIVGIIPLSIWGFIKGYKEGRVNQP